MEQKQFHCLNKLIDLRHKKEKRENFVDYPQFNSILKSRFKVASVWAFPSEVSLFIPLHRTISVNGSEVHSPAQATTYFTTFIAETSNSISLAGSLD